MIYQGGMGQNPCEKYNRKNYPVRRTDPDRTPGKQERITVELEGTKQTDRVEVWVAMDNGETYKINDVLREDHIPLDEQTTA